MDDRLKRHDLTEDEWTRLVALLPAHPRRGHRWADHRMIINGVFCRARTSCSWRRLPETYGSWKTVYNRHRRWSTDGTWETILDALRTGRDEAEDRDRTAGPDSTSAGAHRHTPPGDIRPGGTFEIANW